MAITFLARLRRHAVDRPRHPAVVADGLELSHEALLTRVEAAAAALRASGVGSGAVVGLTVADEVEHWVATLAVMACGAGQIVLASHDPPTLRDAIARRVGVTHELDGASTVRALAALAARPEPPRPSGARLYLKTSGTTGDMNVVAFREADIAAQAERHGEYRDERLLRHAAIEHNNSKRHRLYCCWNGGCNVFRARDGDVAAFVARHGVTCLDVSRLHAVDLAAAPPSAALARVKLRTGGSSIPLAVRRAVEERVTRQLYVRYAATECGAIAMAGPGEHDADESSGRPLPGVELQIVGDDGVPLAAGRSGEIRLRAAGMADGYVDSPSQSARRFRDGWFYPGDCGRLRADGLLVVQGRRDDMIVLNGLNIFPAEIERVLEGHPAVAEAAAFALPSAVHGQIPVAAVELSPGAQATALELQAFGRERLGLRTPRRIVVVASLPRNAQGKTVKTGLAACFGRAAAAS